MKQFFICLCIIGFTGVTAVLGAGQGDQVVLVYNTRVPESKGVAEHYAALREVPSSQILGFDLPDTETIDRNDFRDRLQKPLFKALEDQDLIHFGSRIIPASSGQPLRVEWRVTRAKIRYLLLCYGVPLRIPEDTNLHEEGADKLQIELRRNEAAVDSELICIPIPGERIPLTGFIQSPFYGCTNSQLLNPTNGILMVARLDGPTAAIARGLVDKAIQAEKDGLWGRAYFDLRGITNGAYKLGDDWIGGAAETCRRLGFETIVDTNGGTFPASFPLSQVALYAGWYDEHVSGPFARTTVEFMPGAFAYHLHSFSAASLRTTTHQWAGPLLARGVTATMGCVAEPYLIGTPDIATFFSRFVRFGFSFGEAACTAQRFLSWQTTVIGDPLYHPFARRPQEQFEEMERQHSKLIEWFYLRLINFKLVNGTPVNEAVTTLEGLPETRKSAVLEEKLSDLYFSLGKTDAAIDALQKALKLDPTPQQQIRMMLNLVDRLQTLKRDQEAYAVYQQFLKNFPDYPDLLMIYRHLLDLAHHLGQTADAEKYQHEIDWLASPPAGPHKEATAKRNP